MVLGNDVMIQHTVTLGSAGGPREPFSGRNITVDGFSWALS